MDFSVSNTTGSPSSLNKSCEQKGKADDGKKDQIQQCSKEFGEGNKEQQRKQLKAGCDQDEEEERK